MRRLMRIFAPSMAGAAWFASFNALASSAARAPLPPPVAAVPSRAAPPPLGWDLLEEVELVGGVLGMARAGDSVQQPARKLIRATPTPYRSQPVLASMRLQLRSLGEAPPFSKALAWSSDTSTVIALGRDFRIGKSRGDGTNSPARVGQSRMSAGSSTIAGSRALTTDRYPSLGPNSRLGVSRGNGPPGAAGHLGPHAALFQRKLNGAEAVVFTM
jgi:hypothetical protein